MNDLASPSLEDKVRFLQSPSSHGGEAVHAIETHMSWVFLAGHRALKLKKPVRHAFLDFSTLAAREADCREELRLNQRLAPGVYRGLMALQWHDGAFALVSEAERAEPGRTVDWLVHMRRLPEAQTLERRIAEGRVAPADIDALAGRLARFYRAATPAPVEPAEYLARLQREHAIDRDVLLRPRFELRDAARAVDRLDLAVQRHADLLLRRAREQRLVDGHGDLRPCHVFLLQPPIVIDCLEFNAQMRQVDPFDELAFLGLECELAGAPWIGPRLAAACAEALDDDPPAALLQLYRAQRAVLRARLAIAHLLDAQPRTPEAWAPLAARYLKLALAALDALSESTPRGSP
jgi:aminoglycoside phosphotransferase family enzyme